MRLRIKEVTHENDVKEFIPQFRQYAFEVSKDNHDNWNNWFDFETGDRSIISFRTYDEAKWFLDCRQTPIIETKYHEII
jgi:hypothetical protein